MEKPQHDGEGGQRAPDGEDDRAAQQLPTPFRGPVGRV
jgi:hypothetical protein